MENGTGRNAFIPGFRVAGKTGTAQKVGGGGYLPDKYVASFVGFAPADNPQIAALVIIDEPVGMYYGGQIAAPVFAAMAKDVLQYLKVTPQMPANPAANAAEAHVTVPNVINLLVADAAKELQKAGLNARVEESGERVADQIPKPGSRIPSGSNILLYTLTPRYLTGEVTVPDLQGRTEQEASDLLGELGLSIHPVGGGAQIGRQDPAPYGHVMPGTTVTIYLE